MPATDARVLCPYGNECSYLGIIGLKHFNCLPLLLVLVYFVPTIFIFIRFLEFLEIK